MTLNHRNPLIIFNNETEDISTAGVYQNSIFALLDSSTFTKTFKLYEVTDINGITPGMTVKDFLAISPAPYETISSGGLRGEPVDSPTIFKTFQQEILNSGW